jgi:hypothetical protein
VGAALGCGVVVGMGVPVYMGVGVGLSKTGPHAVDISPKHNKAIQLSVFLHTVHSPRAPDDLQGDK